MARLIRTQISLPPDLKRKAEQLARAKGISFSEYFRRIAGSNVDRVYSRKDERARIAREVKGVASGREGWGALSPAEVYRVIRQGRKDNDERLARLERIRSLSQKRRAV